MAYLAARRTAERSEYVAPQMIDSQLAFAPEFSHLGFTGFSQASELNPTRTGRVGGGPPGPGRPAVRASRTRLRGERAASTAPGPARAALRAVAQHHQQLF